jgi:hypothetical protein
MLTFLLKKFKNQLLSYILAVHLQYFILPSPSIELGAHIAILDNWIVNSLIIILNPIHSFVELFLNFNIDYLPSFGLLIFLTMIIFWTINKFSPAKSGSIN